MFYSSGFLVTFILITISCGDSEAEKIGIIGGKDADIKDFPYEVSFVVNEKHLCGGALIGDKWALTSATCTYFAEPGNHSIRVGSSKLYQGGQVVKVKNMTEHPLFKSYVQDYDLSVLELAEPVKITETVKPIPLFEPGQSPKEGANATISGWGANKFNGTLMPTLQMAVVPIANLCDCASRYSDKYVFITRRMLCVGTENTKDVGVCSGDDGTPLVVDGKLAGINSHFYKCGNATLPAVYTNVATLRDFIKKMTGI